MRRCRPSWRRQALQQHQRPSAVRARVSVLVASIGFLLTGPGSASAQGYPSVQPLAPGFDCVGLACLPDGWPLDVPEAKRPSVPILDGPAGLPRQERPGFYAFDAPTYPRQAVAYVTPVERLHEAPASVKSLPILDGAHGLPGGTLVVFGPQVALFTPYGAYAATEAQGSRTLSGKRDRHRRVRARIAAYGNCPGGKFCIWINADYSGGMLYFTVTDWLNLEAFGFNDRASAFRVYKATDALLATSTGGNGTRRCFDSYTAGWLGAVQYYIDDAASSVFVSSSDGRC
jgi:hypothetical protein